MSLPTYLPSTAFASSLCGTLLLVLTFYHFSRARRPPLPPSPPADPLIGHLRIAPQSEFELFFHKMGEAYGRIMHLNFLGNITIVVNDIRTAIDLLDKRSANYSCRTRVRVVECMNNIRNVGFLPYGKDFQRHRRMFQEFFNKTTSLNYHVIQLREARLLAQNLAVDNLDSAKMENLLNLFSTAIIMDVTYGQRIRSDTDPFVKLADEAGKVIRSVGAIGANILDIFPFLVYMPSWFPGTYYANLARASNPTFRAMNDRPFELVQEEMAKGTAKPSIVASYLNALHNGNEFGFEFDMLDVKGLGTSIYVAGAETTSSSMSIFILAMVLYPQFQLRAQEELDRVLSAGRLPDFGDRASLPYLECIVQETLRWNHPLPIGVPHRVSEDDVYDGMFIPQGSVVVANIRGMTWDEKIYTDAKAFNPERFLPKPEGLGEPLPAATWGFGRRICPGRYLGDASLWIGIATMLSALAISKAVDAEGKEITPKVEFFTSIASRPKPFPCRIQPRSEATREMLRQAVETLEDA